MNIFLPFLLLTILQINCQKQASPSIAIEPLAKKAVAPMGSSTTNADLIKKKLIFENFLNGKKKSEILSIENKTMIDDILQIFPEKTFQNEMKPGLDRDFAWAEFYFYERRFIESAKILSEILDQNSRYPKARNLLARCFYFLGNPDRALLEIDFVLSHPRENVEDLLDALFLTGAIALELPVPSKKTIEKGVNAWETYLKIAPKNDLRGQVETGLKELRLRLKTKPNTSLAFVEESNVKKKRLPNLPPDASRFEKLKAEGLDAFDVEDLLLAEKKLKEAFFLRNTDVEIETALGRILIKTNRFQEALLKFQKVTKLHPRYAPGWHYQGMAYMMNANPQKAVESWKKVMQIDPQYAARFNLKNRIAVAKGMVQ